MLLNQMSGSSRRSAVKLHGPVVILFALLVAAVSGCATSGPAPGQSVAISPYQGYVDFLSEDATLGRSVAREVYGKLFNPNRAAAVIVRHPESGVLRFPFNSDNPRKLERVTDLPLSPMEPTALELSTGVYPFQLLRSRSGSPYASGLFVLYNLREEIQFVTLGRAESGDLILDPDLVRKAVEDEKLVRYTLTMDRVPILTYYLGNRPQPDLNPPGQTTALVDFSGIEGISRFEIDGAARPGFKATLPMTRGVRNLQGRMVPERATYIFSFRVDGTDFKGILKMRNASMETRLTTLDCSITPDLIANAARGALSRFTLTTAGEEEIILEIAFGLRRGMR